MRRPTWAQGVAAVERLLGVRPAPGGKHAGLGTHNALLGLGEGAYIEVIAPDPEQPPPSRPLPFGLPSLQEPQLVTFAVRTTDIDGLVSSARRAGYDPGPVIDMSRTRTDGTILRWRLAFQDEMPAGGVVPFVIDWGDTPHPSAGLPQAGRLASLSAEHPQPKAVQEALRALGFEMPVEAGEPPQLTATIERDGRRFALR